MLPLQLHLRHGSQPPRCLAGRQGRNRAERSHQPVERDRVTSRQPASPGLVAAFVALPPGEYSLGSKQHYHSDGGKQEFLSRSLRIGGQLLQPLRWGPEHSPHSAKTSLCWPHKLQSRPSPQSLRDRDTQDSVPRPSPLGARKTPEIRRSPNPRECRCPGRASGGGRRAGTPA